MKYGDDQCEECGGIRVTNSTLCVGCLVRRLDAERAENLIKRSIIEALKLEIAKLDKRLCVSLDYGFRANKENVYLKRRIKEVTKIIKREVNNEKGRV